jgi:hypothetical protein
MTVVSGQEYAQTLLESIEYLLRQLKHIKTKKILAFYKKKVKAFIKSNTQEPFTEPLVAHYIMYGMALLHKERQDQGISK